MISFNLFLLNILSVLLVLPAQAQNLNYVPGEVIVKFKEGYGKNAASKLGSGISSRFVVRSIYSNVGLQKLGMKGGGDVRQFIAELQKDPAVEYAEPNYILSKPIDSSDNNQIFSQADFEAMSGGGYTQSGAQIRVADAWPQMVSMGSNNTPIVVAVVDTGVDYTHSVFTNANAIWSNPNEVANNGIDDDGNGYVDDVRGWNFNTNNNDPMDDDDHGTHVAGIVYGVGQSLTDNSNSKIKIMPLKFLGADGSGSTSGAIAAINYAAANGAKVINCSWGGESYSQALHDALAAAYAKGIFIAAAAGNYASNNDSKPLYPASYGIPGSMSIAASNDFDNLASFSNYGATSVHIAAPGVAIYSTIPNNTYKYMNGTSMATPLIAGVAAVMLREAPQLSGYQIKNLLMSSSTSKSSLASKTSSGSRVDVLSALNAAKNETNTPTLIPAYSSLAGREPAAEAQGGGGCGTVGFINPNSGPFNNSSLLAIVFALAMLPLLVWSIVRAQVNSRDMRRHERFVMNSAITVTANGKELVGQMRTISVGGLSFNADKMLEKGGVVSIKIHSPEGSEQIEVQGHIVWSEQNKAYGVQFDQAPKSIIESWTSKLLKAS